MTNRALLLLVIILITMVGLLHYFGFSLQLYWRIDWYDHVVHTLAGFSVALGFFYICQTRLKYFSNGISVFLWGTVAALIIGVAWEIFEVQYGITHIADHNYIFDTAGDIISDIIGGALASWYACKRLKLIQWNTKN